MNVQEFFGPYRMIVDMAEKLMSDPRFSYARADMDVDEWSESLAFTQDAILEQAVNHGFLNYEDRVLTLTPEQQETIINAINDHWLELEKKNG